MGREPTICILDASEERPSAAIMQLRMHHAAGLAHLGMRTVRSPTRSGRSRVETNLLPEAAIFVSFKLSYEASRKISKYLQVT